MSSDSNGEKRDSTEPGPVSGPGSRQSAAAPSAWGAARDALAAVHNLSPLLRNASVTQPTLLDLLPELRSSAEVLRGAFGRTDDSDTAAAEVAERGARRIQELDALLDAIGLGEADREDLATHAASLADDLEALADLLALLDRAASPVAIEVSLDLVVREAGRMSGSARGRELAVRFDRGPTDCIVTTDPYLLGPLLSLVVAYVHEAGIAAPVVRARASPNAQLIVEEAGAGDHALPVLPMRVMPWVPPSERAARRVAERIGATLELGDARGSIAVFSAAAKE
jgi:hypothetical protein